MLISLVLALYLLLGCHLLSRLLTTVRFDIRKLSSFMPFVLILHVGWFVELPKVGCFCCKLGCRYNINTLS